jgi:hypothetical protein
MARKCKKYLTVVFGKNKNKNKNKQTSFNPTISLSLPIRKIMASGNNPHKQTVQK